jgi:hypothetical protein
MPLEMLWFTNAFRWKCKIDKRGHLQWFIQEFGNHTQQYERALNHWQRVMPLEMLWFTNAFRWKCKIDKRGHLQWFIQEFGNHTQQDFHY